MATAPGASGPARAACRAPLVGLAVALAAQAVVLYAPRQPGPVPFVHADKVVHVGVFLVPAVLALLAGFRGRVVVGLLVAHAVVSEVVQARLLPGRSGDPADVLADVVGVGVGLLLALAADRRAARAPSGAPSVRW